MICLHQFHIPSRQLGIHLSADLLKMYLFIAWSLGGLIIAQQSWCLLQFFAVQKPCLVCYILAAFLSSECSLACCLQVPCTQMQPVDSAPAYLCYLHWNVCPAPSSKLHSHHVQGLEARELPAVQQGSKCPIKGYRLWPVSLLPPRPDLQ